MSEAKHGSFYYPQAALILRVRFEDFGKSEALISNEYFDIKCIARNISVTINDYSQADTFDCEIDYKYFPFDPRAIRACGVTIAMQDMGRLYLDNNQNIPFEFTNENIVFMGFADEESISFDDSKKVVKLEGRDNTGILIDEKFLKGVVDVSAPVDTVIKTLLFDIEATKNMEVVVRIDGQLPQLSNFWSDIEEMSGKKNTGKDQSYWDVIQSIVADAGLIAFVELDKLILTRPRELYNSSVTPRFVYGENLKNLELKRKIGRKKGFNIIVRCLNTDTKEVIQAKIPLEGTKDWSDATGISLGEVKIPKRASVVGVNKAGNSNNQPTTANDDQVAPYISFRVTNITSKEALIAVAENIYEEMSRQQIEGSFESNEMKIKVEEDVFNILKLRNGTPISIDIKFKDSVLEEGSLQLNEIQSRLKKLGYDPRTANTLSRSLNLIKKKFYTKSVTFKFDSERGFSFSLEFLNFIDVKKYVS